MSRIPTNTGLSGPHPILPQGNYGYFLKEKNLNIDVDCCDIVIEHLILSDNLIHHFASKLE